jgi:hypothetical protein
LLGDLIEIGVTFSTQCSAKDMNDIRLKRVWGPTSFCGAIDTQDAVANGTPDDVRACAAVSRIWAARRIYPLVVHCIQPDVPPETIAMLRSFAVAGRYPLDMRAGQHKTHLGEYGNLVKEIYTNVMKVKPMWSRKSSGRP